MTQTDRHSIHLLRWAVVTASVSVLLAGCGDKAASQTAATVNGEVVTLQQVNQVLSQQRGLRPEQAQTASRQILERLIDQELAVQKAKQLKLDSDARVVQQLEAARREIMSRAYLEQAGEAAKKPTPEEIAKYYEEQPALFKDRRIYSLQEIAIDASAEQIPTLKSRLEGSKNVAEFVEFLKANDFHFNGNQAVRAAEQLPLASLQTFARMTEGQALLNVSPTGAQVIVLAGARPQPVSLEQAKPAIEQFLLNDRKRDIVAKDMKALRDAATIQYAGKFGDSASAPAGATPAPAASVEPGGSSASNAGFKQ